MVIISSGIGKSHIKDVVCSIENVKYIKTKGINQYFETPNDLEYVPIIKLALSKDKNTSVLFYSFVMNEINI